LPREGHEHVRDVAADDVETFAQHVVSADDL
jgi:hypothetical protein